MKWQWHGRILKHTPAHLRHGHAHTYCIHTGMHTIAARTLEWGAACLQYASHPHVYTNTLYKSMCAPTPAHSFLISLSRTRTPTHSQSYITTCQYCGQAFIEPLRTHSPPAFFSPLSSSSFLFFWQTDDEEWLKMEMCDTFPYKATQFLKPTSVFFSPSRHRGARRRRKKGLQPTKKCLGMTQGPKKPAS